MELKLGRVRDAAVGAPVDVRKALLIHVDEYPLGREGAETTQPFKGMMVQRPDKALSGFWLSFVT